jgi:xylulose-5-phosphate/fructose-6-phosphate phosphoketolase
LLREPLKIEHVKPRMLGHWGSDAGQTFTYIHFNRLIKKYDLNAIYVSGPGHGAPSVLSQGYLEGTYSEIYPDKSEDLARISHSGWGLEGQSRQLHADIVGIGGYNLRGS